MLTYIGKYMCAAERSERYLLHEQSEVLPLSKPNQSPHIGTSTT